MESESSGSRSPTLPKKASFSPERHTQGQGYHGLPQHSSDNFHDSLEQNNASVLYDSLEQAPNASNFDTGTENIPGSHLNQVHGSISHHSRKEVGIGGKQDQRLSQDSREPSPADSLSPTPRKTTKRGDRSPVQASTQSAARDSALRKSSSSVYAVANPAILVAQGTPQESQQNVRITPRVEQAIQQEHSQHIKRDSAVAKETSEVSRNNNANTHANTSERKSRENTRGSARNNTSSRKNTGDKKSRGSARSVSFQQKVNVDDSDSDDGRLRDQRKQEGITPTKLGERVPTPHPISPRREGNLSKRNQPDKIQEWDTLSDKSLDTLGPQSQESPPPERTDKKKPFTKSYKIPSPDGRKTDTSLPTVKRVYVDSPTFTKEEEEQFRFVESRLEDVDQETYRTPDNNYSDNKRSSSKENDMAANDSLSNQDRREEIRERYKQNNKMLLKKDSRDYGRQEEDTGYYPSNESRSESEKGAYGDQFQRRGQGHPDNRYEDRGQQQRGQDSRYEDRNRDIPQDRNRGNYDQNRYEDRNDRDGYNSQYNRDRYEDNSMRDRYEDRNEQNRYENRNDKFQERYEPRNDWDGQGDGRYNGHRGYDDRGDQNRYNDRRGDQNRYDDRRGEQNPYDDRRGDQNRYNDRRGRDEQTGRPHDQSLINKGYGVNDEDDQALIKQEETYQAHLKQRLHSQVQRDSEIDIPKLPLDDQYDADPWQNPQPPPPVDQHYYGGPPPQDIRNGYGPPPPDEDGYGPPPVDNPYGYDLNETARMEVVHPPQPRYDFVENNKVDYGIPPDKSYSFIVERKKSAEKKLENVFVRPKLPSKNKSQGAPSMRTRDSEMNSPQDDMLSENASTAEALWAKRSKGLKRRDTGNTNKSKTASGTSLKKNRSLQKYPSQNGLVRQPLYQGYSQNTTQPPMYGTPTRNHYLEPLESHPSPTSKPQPVESRPPPGRPENFRRPLELKPITQEILTEDGQRISVDINLKVHSPRGDSPPRYHAEVLPGSQGTGGTRPIGSQYSYQPYVDREQQDQYRPYYQPQIPPPEEYNFNYGQENRAPDVNDSYDSQVQQQTGYSAIDYPNEPVHGTYREPIEPQQEMASPTNPYVKIPPIKTTHGADGMIHVDMGYAARYKREKERNPESEPWYQVYTVKDYRRLKNELEAGRGVLGPDLDTELFKEKVEKKHKQNEYARMVNEKNRQDFMDRKPKRQPDERKMSETEATKRRAALEYARKVPRPTVKPRPSQFNSYEVSSQLSPAAPKAPSPSKNQVEVINLQKLQKRHEEEKQNVAKIKQNLDHSIPQKV